MGNKKVVSKTLKTMHKIHKYQKIPLMMLTEKFYNQRCLESNLEPLMLILEKKKESLKLMI